MRTAASKPSGAVLAGAVRGAKVGVALGLAVFGIAVMMNARIDWPITEFLHRPPMIVLRGTELWHLMAYNVTLGFPVVVILSVVGALAGAACSGTVTVIKRVVR